MKEQTLKGQCSHSFSSELWFGSSSPCPWSSATLKTFIFSHTFTPGEWPALHTNTHTLVEWQWEAGEGLSVYVGYDQCGARLRAVNRIIESLDALQMLLLCLVQICALPVVFLFHDGQVLFVDVSYVFRVCLEFISTVSPLLPLTPPHSSSLPLCLQPVWSIHVMAGNQRQPGLRWRQWLSAQIDEFTHAWCGLVVGPCGSVYLHTLVCNESDVFVGMYCSFRSQIENQSRTLEEQQVWIRSKEIRHEVHDVCCRDVWQSQRNLSYSWNLNKDFMSSLSMKEGLQIFAAESSRWC